MVEWMGYACIYCLNLRLFNEEKIHLKFKICPKENKIFLKLFRAPCAQKFYVNQFEAVFSEFAFQLFYSMQIQWKIKIPTCWCRSWLPAPSRSDLSVNNFKSEGQFSFNTKSNRNVIKIFSIKLQFQPKVDHTTKRINFIKKFLIMSFSKEVYLNNVES